MLLSERIEKAGITVSSQVIGQSEGGLRYKYAVSLRRGDRVYDHPAPYESNDKVTTFELMDHILIGCSFVDQATSREEWRGEFVTPDAYMEWPAHWDAVYSEADYAMWQGINEKLREFVGGHQAHGDWLYDTDRQG